MNKEVLNEELVWKPIISGTITTMYSVSENGLVRNDKTKRLLKAHDDHRGYLAYTIYPEKNRKKRCKMHRLVAEAFIVKPTEILDDFHGWCVDHINNITYDNHYTNLQWLTQAENTKKRKKAKSYGKRKGYKVVPPSFLSPEGIVYHDVKHITNFAKEHKLSARTLSNLSCGITKMTKQGWSLA